MTVLAGGEGGNRQGSIIDIQPNAIYVEWHAPASLTERGTQLHYDGMIYGAHVCRRCRCHCCMWKNPHMHL